jgi:hypothetical protein
MDLYYMEILDIIPDSELICDYELELRIRNIDRLESIKIE